MSKSLPSSPFANTPRSIAKHQCSIDGVEATAFMKGKEYAQIWQLPPGQEMPKVSLKLEFLNEFRLIQNLAEGGFGVVMSARRKRDNKLVAVKYIARSKVVNWDVLLFEDSSEVEVPLEVVLLNQLRRVDGVVKLLEVYASKTNDSYLIVMENFELATDMFDFITNRGKLSVGEAKNYFKQVIDILIRIKECDVCHRDIKDENLLIDLSTNKIILIDFGSGSMGHRFTDFQGTKVYAPPEWFTKHEYEGESASVWMLGILLFVFVTGDVPFKDVTEIVKNKRPKVPSKLPKELRELIKWCMAEKAEHRPTFNDLLQHDWLNSSDPNSPFNQNVSFKSFESKCANSFPLGLWKTNNNAPTTPCDSAAPPIRSHDLMCTNETDGCVCATSPRQAIPSNRVVPTTATVKRNLNDCVTLYKQNVTGSNFERSHLLPREDAATNDPDHSSLIDDSRENNFSERSNFDDTSEFLDSGGYKDESMQGVCLYEEICGQYDFPGRMDVDPVEYAERNAVDSSLEKFIVYGKPNFEEDRTGDNSDESVADVRYRSVDSSYEDEENDDSAEEEFSTRTADEDTSATEEESTKADVSRDSMALPENALIRQNLTAPHLNSTYSTNDLQLSRTAIRTPSPIEMPPSYAHKVNNTYNVERPTFKLGRDDLDPTNDVVAPNKSKPVEIGLTHSTPPGFAPRISYAFGDAAQTAPWCLNFLASPPPPYISAETYSAFSITGFN